MNYHCLQELVEEYLEQNNLGSEQLEQSRITHTVSKDCYKGRKKDISNLFQSSVTLDSSMEGFGKDMLTWYLEDFLAKTSALLVKEKELLESDQDSGKKCTESSKKLNHDTSSLKTHQCYALEDYRQSSKTLPIYGSMQNGYVLELGKLELGINEIESGYWRTPTATEGQRGQGQIIEAVKTGNHISKTGRKIQITLDAQARVFHDKNRWATPTTMDSLPTKSEKALHKEATQARKGRSKPANLRDQVHPEQMRLWNKFQNFPTPTARIWKDNGKSPSELARNSKTLSVVAGGKLNPDWVEWLMGFPIGWTSSKPLKTLETYPINEEPDIERVSIKTEDRKERLQAIGNAQVPLVAAIAFKTLCPTRIVEQR